MCIDQCQLPTLWKTSSIIPVPKSKNPKELSDFRPVALTSLVMKTFERVLKEELVFLVFGKLDPLQFAYQAGKGVEDENSLFLTKFLNIWRSQKHMLDFYSLTSLQLLIRCNRTF